MQHRSNYRIRPGTVRNRYRLECGTVRDTGSNQVLSEVTGFETGNVIDTGSNPALSEIQVQIRHCKRYRFESCLFISEPPHFLIIAEVLKT